MPVAATPMGADLPVTSIRAGPGHVPFLSAQPLTAGFGALFALLLGRPPSDQSGQGGSQDAPAPPAQPGRPHRDETDPAALQLAAAQLVLPGVQAPAPTLMQAPGDPAPASTVRSPAPPVDQTPSLAAAAAANVANTGRDLLPDPGPALQATARSSVQAELVLQAAQPAAVLAPVPQQPADPGRQPAQAAAPADPRVPLSALLEPPVTGITPAQPLQQAPAPQLPPVAATAAPSQAPAHVLTPDPQQRPEGQAQVTASASAVGRPALQVDQAPEPQPAAAAPAGPARKAEAGSSEQPVATDPKTQPHQPPAPHAASAPAAMVAAQPQPPASPHTEAAQLPQSPAPATPHPAERMQPAALPARVMQWLQTGPGNGQIQVHLEPEHLGTMVLRLSVERGQVHATALVSTGEAKQALETNLDRLRHDLAGQGLSLSGFSVSVDSGTSSGRQGAQPDPTWWQQYRGTGAATPAPAPRPVPQLRYSSGRLDVRA